MSTPSGFNNGHADAIAILGIPFDRVSVADATARIEGMVASRQPHYLVTANVDFLVQAREDVELRRILVSAHMVLCDGTPLLWASRLLGNPIPERVAGSDLVPELIRLAEKKSYRAFLLGGSPESAARAVDRVRQKHPQIHIDWYSPPFSPLLDMDHEEIRRRIQAAKPDLLFVSFGCPKQEKWIAMHYRDMGVPVAVGVGATVDFLAEQVKRAPAWMQRSGTEWVYRLMQEPRRLAGRYAKDLCVFSSAFLQQYVRERMPCFGRECLGHANFIMEGSWRYARLPQQMLAGSSVENTFFPGNNETTHCVVDASGVRRIDGTGVASLVRLQTRVTAWSGRLLLLAPSRPLERALRFARIWDLFETAEDLAAARSWLQARNREDAACVRHQSTASGFRIIWHGEVTAANAETVWAATLAILAERSPAGMAGAEAVLNLREVAFIDSTGLGMILRLRKRLQSQGAGFHVEEVQPPVSNVIQLAQLELLLLGPPGEQAFRQQALKLVSSPADAA